jgi:hypothetical protein
MCDACRKLDPPDAPKVQVAIFDKVGSSQRKNIEYPSLSDRYVHYWNAVAERVEKVHPQLLLVVDAYSVYATPPVREKLHPNLVVRYVPSDAEGWEGWKIAGAKKLFWRPNNLHSGYREATINNIAAARQIVDTMRRFAADGMVATDIQGIYENWATQGINYQAAGGDEAIRRRIAFLRAGFDYSALTARAGQMRLAAQNQQPFDKPLAARLLDQRWLLMRQMYHRDLLPVNVVLVAGYDATNWRPLGWVAPGEKAKSAPITKSSGPDDDWLHEDQSQTGTNTRGR